MLIDMYVSLNISHISDIPFYQNWDSTFIQGVSLNWDWVTIRKIVIITLCFWDTGCSICCFEEFFFLILISTVLKKRADKFIPNSSGVDVGSLRGEIEGKIQLHLPLLINLWAVRFIFLSTILITVQM